MVDVVEVRQAEGEKDEVEGGKKKSRERSV